MIRGHVWRPMNDARKDSDSPCQFMNCRRLKAEHQRAVSQVSLWRR